eukprot:782013-Amphidinium_carterae.4
MWRVEECDIGWQQSRVEGCRYKCCALIAPVSPRGRGSMTAVRQLLTLVVTGGECALELCGLLASV